jgi:hypothetical protein
VRWWSRGWRRKRWRRRWRGRSWRWQWRRRHTQHISEATAKVNGEHADKQTQEGKAAHSKAPGHSCLRHCCLHRLARRVAAMHCLQLACSLLLLARRRRGRSSDGLLRGDLSRETDHLMGALAVPGAIGAGSDLPSFETLLNRLHMIKPPLELLHVCIIQRTQRITLNAFEEYLGRLWRCRRIRLCSDDLLLRSTRLLRRRSIRGAAEKRRPAPKSPIGHSTMLLGIQDLHRRGAFPRCVRRRRPRSRERRCTRVWSEKTFKVFNQIWN